MFLINIHKCILSVMGWWGRIPRKAGKGEIRIGIHGLSVSENDAP